MQIRRYRCVHEQRSCRQLREQSSDRFCPPGQRDPPVDPCSGRGERPAAACALFALSLAAVAADPTPPSSRSNPGNGASIMVLSPTLAPPQSCIQASQGLSGYQSHHRFPTDQNLNLPEFIETADHAQDRDLAANRRLHKCDKCIVSEHGSDQSACLK